MGRLSRSLYLLVEQIQMLKSSRKALSLELLSKHQQRIKNMVSRIENYQPQFHLNKNYGSSRKAHIVKRMEQRQKLSDQLFEQNMKLITRIETTGPKIQTKKFPSVSPNPQRIKSLSHRSRTTSRSNAKFKTKDVFRNEEELFQENIKLITTIECTGPKIQCWVSKKSRKLSELVVQKKREEQKRILDKYREISREFNKLAKMSSYRRSSSIGSARSRSEAA